MSNTDSSASARLRQVKAQTLAQFRAANPLAREGGGAKSADASLVTQRASGLAPVVRQTDTIPVQVTAGCCTSSIPACISVSAPIDITRTSSDYIDPNFIENYTWTPNSNATSYTLSSSWPSMTFSNITSSSVTVTYQWDGGSAPEFTITAVNACSSATSEPVITFPCFLAGSLVAMADGTEKVIEDVKVGDEVLGAFGEINVVLALHRPLLGSASMISINGEHSSTAHHPHIGTDRKFYCANPSALGATYGLEHEVLNAAGNPEMRLLHGLKSGRVHMYELGQSLKTVEGSRIMNTLEPLSMPADTQLYNLVVSGSHTYHVDGYAVTGWPREDDFDYDSWTAI
jgi:hypothetical protein